MVPFVMIIRLEVIEVSPPEFIPPQAVTASRMESRTRLVAASLVLALILSVATTVMAEDKPGSPFKDLCLKLMGMSKKTVEKEVNAVGRGIKKGANVVVEEVKDVGKLATGDTSKAKDILVKPVMGTTEAVGETAHDVINAPIEAGKEVSGECTK